jgi:hypothetical protein
MLEGVVDIMTGAQMFTDLDCADDVALVTRRTEELRAASAAKLELDASRQKTIQSFGTGVPTATIAVRDVIT